jgi:hypothetical protein
MAIKCKKLFKGSLPPAGRLRARTILIAVVATLLSGCGPAIHELKAPVAAPARFSESGTSP